jgi:hypothetical protein
VENSPRAFLKGRDAGFLWNNKASHLNIN